MQKMKIAAKIFSSFVCGLAMLSSAVFASCHPPRYRHIGTMNSHTGLLRVVIESRDLNLEAVVCLAEALKEKHPEWQHVTLLFFTSMSDARHFSPGPRIELPAVADKAQSSVHLMYELDRSKGTEHLDVLPYGWRTSVADTTQIGLPLAGATHCRFELATRCLLGVESNFAYPSLALSEKVSARIILAGTITPLGTMNDIRVKEASVSSPAVRQSLVNVSIRNFSTWQLEAKGDRTPVEVTYEYDLGASPVNDRVRVEFALPKVTIKATP
jgi:hypothetical protein